MVRRASHLRAAISPWKRSTYGINGRAAALIPAASLARCGDRSRAASHDTHARPINPALTAMSGVTNFAWHLPQRRVAAEQPLPPRSNAVDAPICIAADVIADRSTCHRPGMEHDAGPGNATARITNIRAVHDRRSRSCAESDACKPQQNDGCNPCNRHRPDRKTLVMMHGLLLTVLASRSWWKPHQPQSNTTRALKTDDVDIDQRM